MLTLLNLFIKLIIQKVTNLVIIFKYPCRSKVIFCIFWVFCIILIIIIINGSSFRARHIYQMNGNLDGVCVDVFSGKGVYYVAFIFKSMNSSNV